MGHPNIHPLYEKLFCVMATPGFLDNWQARPQQAILKHHVVITSMFSLFSSDYVKCLLYLIEDSFTLELARKLASGAVLFAEVKCHHSEQRTFPFVEFESVIKLSDSIVLGLSILTYAFCAVFREPSKFIDQQKTHNISSFNYYSLEHNAMWCLCPFPCNLPILIFDEKKLQWVGNQEPRVAVCHIIIDQQLLYSISTKSDESGVCIATVSCEVAPKKSNKLTPWIHSCDKNEIHTQHTYEHDFLHLYIKFTSTALFVDSSKSD